MRGIKPGQLWRDLSNYARIIRVMRINGDVVMIENVKTGRKTKARPHRFNGKEGGYMLLEDENHGRA